MRPSDVQCREPSPRLAHDEMMQREPVIQKLERVGIKLDVYPDADSVKGCRDGCRAFVDIDGMMCWFPERTHRTEDLLIFYKGETWEQRARREW